MSRIAWRMKSGTTKGTLVDNEAGAIGLRDGWNYPGMSFEPWRVVKVRILTPAESRRKAVAEALREAACDARARADDRLRNYADWRGQSAHLIDADALDAKADALWPRKGAGTRDARIAELEAALAGLVDATKVHAEYHGPAAGHHRDDCPEDGTCSDCLFDRNICDHIEDAERALGRRK